MKQKNSFSYLLAAMLLLFAGCSSDITEQIPETQPNDKLTVPTTTMQIRGANDSISLSPMKATETASTTIAGWNQARAYFFIRVDGKIQEEPKSYPPEQYIPTGKYNYISTQTTENDQLHGGVIDLTQPLYQQADNSKLVGVYSYIYAPDGVNTSKVIVDQPDIQGMLDSYKPGLNADDYKVIWYVAKYVPSDYCWHVDGILTSKETQDISETSQGEEITKTYDPEGTQTKPKIVPGLVEVNVHEQEHKDWGEIKTSIHIRCSEIDGMTVNIPLSREYQVEADDFAIRTYQAYYKIGDSEVPVNVTVEHASDAIKIHVTVNDKVKALIAKLLNETSDGLTIEVHSYCLKEGADEQQTNKIATAVYKAVFNSSVTFSNKKNPENYIISRTSYRTEAPTTE